VLFDVRDGLSVLDVAVRVNDVGDAARVFRIGVRTCSISRAHALGGVAQQWKVEVKLLCKSLVVGNVVKRDAEDCFVLAKFWDSITESLALNRSARGVGFGVEPEQYALACVIGERPCGACVVLQLEVRRSSAGREQGRFLFEESHMAPRFDEKSVDRGGAWRASESESTRQLCEALFKDEVGAGFAQCCLFSNSI
jgi:hypothetical protein